MTKTKTSRKLNDKRSVASVLLICRGCCVIVTPKFNIFQKSMNLMTLTIQAVKREASQEKQITQKKAYEIYDISRFFKDLKDIYVIYTT